MKANLQGLTLKEVVDLLEIILTRLDLDSNFEGFEADLEIAAGQTTTIRNNLTYIPNRYIILSQQGNGLVTKTGIWSKNFIYLKNNGLEDVSIKIVFLK